MSHSVPTLSIGNRAGVVFSICSILPPIVKNVLLVVGLGRDGFESAGGWPGDFYSLVLLGFLWIATSGALACLSRWLLGGWPRVVLIILCAFLIAELVQSISMFATVRNLEACGYPLCYGTDE